MTAIRHNAASDQGGPFDTYTIVLGPRASRERIARHGWSTARTVALSARYYEQPYGIARTVAWFWVSIDFLFWEWDVILRTN